MENHMTLIIERPRLAPSIAARRRQVSLDPMTISMDDAIPDDALTDGIETAQKVDVR